MSAPPQDRTRPAATTRTGHSAPRRSRRPVDSVPVWLKAVGVVVAALFVLPTLVVVPMSFTAGGTFRFPPAELSTQWYESFFTDPRWTAAVGNTVQVALTVMVLATVLGTAAAVGLSRMRSRWAGLLRATLMLPLVSPGIVIAVAVYVSYLQWRLVGTFGGYVLVHTAMAIPFVLVSVGASLGGFDNRLLLAAQSLGATPWRAFRTVQLRLIAPGVVSGAVFAFVTSLDEVVVALFLRAPQFETLPVRMFNSVTVEIDPTVAAASSMLVVLVTALILFPQVFRLLRRRRSNGKAMS
ncbi:ABC transporter permease [Pseudonocardia nematodicida]|uniref:ABC transporter permease n=1 Tax=Pseudonocardia nematodicida TaxID=1206997 RepID=A0ABV1K4B9_9PSEU